MKQLINLFLLLLLCYEAKAQDLFPASGRVYEDSEVPRVYITMDADDLNGLMKEQNWYKDELYPAGFKWSDLNGIETFDNVGIRLRGNTSRESGKKSFKIKFKAFGGEEFFGLSDLNLNGEHNDPTLSRANIGWDLMKTGQVPSPRANHVALYINEEYRGLYANVEHIDQDYLNTRYEQSRGNLYKLNYGCSFEFEGTNPNLYKFKGADGERVYELKTNEIEDDYSNLAAFITILNDLGNPDFICDLESIFDVDLYLRALAVEALIGHWDNPSINSNNAYLYEDPKSGQIKYIPFDIDNTFGIDWFDVDWTSFDVNNWQAFWQNRPIFKNLMRVKEYKHKYNYFLNELLQNAFNEGALSLVFDDLHELLRPFVMNDTYYPLTYGFDLSDFDLSFSEAVGGHVKEGLASYTIKRHESALDQLIDFDIYPIVKTGYHEIINNDLIISMSFNPETVSKVILNLDSGNGFETIELNDNGMGADVIANDGTYSFVMDIDVLERVTYFFEIKSVDNTAWSYPKCQNIEIDISAHHMLDDHVYINEFMASNSFIKDPFGETDDWIELYNAHDEYLDMKGLYLTDDINEPLKWALPNQLMAPKSFTLLWADDQEDQGALHTSFKLNKEGEFIGLFRSIGNTIVLVDSLSYRGVQSDISYGLIPDGEGEYISLNTITPGFSNLATSGVSIDQTVSLKVYPNPTGDIIHLEDNKAPLNFEQLRIYNSAGTQVLNVKNEDFNEESKVSVSHLHPGLYFIQLEHKNKIQLTKFIKI